jgi:prepilin-type processing-associated H-X9-DG protein
LKKHAGTCLDANPLINANHLWPDSPSFFPEYWTDVNVAKCPSDPDDSKFDQYFRREPLEACYFWDISYQYPGYALQPEHYLASGVPFDKHPADVGDLNPDIMTVALTDYAFSGGYAPGMTLPTDSSEWPGIHEDDISLGAQTLYRLREGIERFFISDINNPAASAMAQSELPVMWDIALAPRILETVSFNHIPGGANVLYMDGHVKFIKHQEEWPICSTWIFFLGQLVGVMAP